MIDIAVSAATGEPISEIRRRGFVLADPPFPDFDPEPSRRAAQGDEPGRVRFLPQSVSPIRCERTVKARIQL